MILQKKVEDFAHNLIPLVGFKDMVRSEKITYIPYNAE